MIEIPYGLKQALESGQCVLFIGSGIGKNMFDEYGCNAPTGIELAKSIVEKFTPGIDCSDLAKVSQYVEIKNKSRIELETYIKQIFSKMKPDDIYKWIPTVRWKAIYTTNYDNCLQQAFDSCSKPALEPHYITYNQNLMDFDPRFQVPIYYLHGSLFIDEDPHIILTERDYTKYAEKRKMMFEQLKYHFATSNILYIGYSNNDSNWKQLFTEIREEFTPNSLPYSYRIDPFPNEIDVAILKDSNIETIKCTFTEFVKEISKDLNDTYIDTTKRKELVKNIPTDLQNAFEKNPTSVLRLLSAWDFINNAPFNEKPNISDFLRGEKPNWSLIGNSGYFARDIEDDVYDSILDYCTSLSIRPKVSVILGSAGYGVTTLMMVLAKRAVWDKAGRIFFHKPFKDIREGDIEYALSLSDDKAIFFIDNAADNIEIINTLYKKYNDAKKSCMFILGERKNEWQQVSSKLQADFFEILPLSDGEIDRLIALLRENDELNHLANLSYEMQIAAIKKNYSSELLVTIREATEGKSFDAIIEDEFRGINSDFSQKAYLTVCCFYQHGAYIRQSILANILNVEEKELYELTHANTDGIMIYDCLDEENGIYALRARHRIISQIVWERCGEQSLKQQITQDALDNLNLYYNVDKLAFKAFICSDHFIDSLKTLEDKTKFFDRAINKDPDNPYVRQHYARMLLRAHKMNLALSQIEESLSINKSARILYHTKGLILSEMMKESPLDIARKRLLQSEDCFNQALAMYSKDEYSYQGLAQLYLNWAKLISQISEQEETDYIAKAENVINIGLKKVKQKESLLIESSKIQDYLNEQSSRIHCLEKALKENGNSMIVRFLLARAYRQNKRYQEAVDILKPVIILDHSEYRAFIEYTYAVLALGCSYAEAISILKQATLYGYSDPRFISLYGGVLFMNKNFKESKDVFIEFMKRDTSGIDLYQIYFKPFIKEPENFVRLNGRVKTVKSGCSIIDTEEYPEFMCPGSKYNGLALETNMTVSFIPAFTPKGRIATDIKLLTL